MHDPHVRFLKNRLILESHNWTVDSISQVVHGPTAELLEGSQQSVTEEIPDLELVNMDCFF